jgi:ABC-type dipeptide/oligopeptide/nickel transport system ATPase component
VGAFWLRLRGVRTLALVGKSGTGKSFRAHLICARRKIDVIIDDGLIVQDRTILFGQSSKKEMNPLAAVRRALFDEPGNAAEARKSLHKTRFRSVLILGTSLEMTNRIALNLGLPRPSEIFRIEDVASPDEMKAAGARRKRKGAHYLPLPPVAVRFGLRGALGSRVRAVLAATLRRRRPLPPAARPLSYASREGEVVFSESAIGQMVHHCIQEYDRRLSLEKLTVTRQGALYSLEVHLTVPFKGMTSGGLHSLRENITKSLERYAGILVEVTLVVGTIEDGEVRT